jgi:hypothetical protein
VAEELDDGELVQVHELAFDHGLLCFHAASFHPPGLRQGGALRAPESNRKGALGASKERQHGGGYESSLKKAQANGQARDGGTRKPLRAPVAPR